MPTREETVEINGEPWKIRFTKLRGNQDGYCYYDQRKILVNSDICLERRIEVLVHEVIHACLPCLSEEAVVATSGDITESLIACGYGGMLEND